MLSILKLWDVTAYEAIDPSLKNSINENIEKVNASTSCDDLLINANATNIMPELAPSREKELMDQVAILKSSVEKLSRGEYIHKEILFNNARDYGKRGLGSFPEPNIATTPSPEIKTSFIKEVGSYCQHCQVTGTTLGSALYHHVLFLNYQRITHQCFKITIFF